MNKIICFLLASAFSANAYAFDLTGFKAVDIKDREAVELPAAVPAKAAPEKYASAYQNIFIQIRSQPSLGAVDASDMMAAITIGVRKAGEGWYRVSNRVDMAMQSGDARKILNNEWELSGPGINLSISELSGNYTISGNVYAPGPANGCVNLSVDKRADDFSYYVSGAGMNLSVDSDNINGGYVTSVYSKEALTAILSLFLSVQADKASTEPLRK